MANLRFTVHALQRMFERNISPAECKSVLDDGETIETYPQDTPFPSALKLGFVNGRPIHLVLSHDSDTIHIITAYEPTQARWGRDYRTRGSKEND